MGGASNTHGLDVIHCHQSSELSSIQQHGHGDRGIDTGLQNCVRKWIEKNANWSFRKQMEFNNMEISRNVFLWQQLMNHYNLACDSVQWKILITCTNSENIEA
jgi:hypothetical protein